MAAILDFYELRNVQEQLFLHNIDCPLLMEINYLLYAVCAKLFISKILQPPPLLEIEWWLPNCYLSCTTLFRTICAANLIYNYPQTFRPKAEIHTPILS